MNNLYIKQIDLPTLTSGANGFIGAHYNPRTNSICAYEAGAGGGKKE